MAQCTFCKEETEIYDGGDVPVCVECLDRRQAKRDPSATEQHAFDYTALSHDFLEATARYHEATGEFEAVTVSCEAAHRPQQRIKIASSNLTVARKEMLKAYDRLNGTFGRPSRCNLANGQLAALAIPSNTIICGSA